MGHPDFYSVAVTSALVFVLGGYFLMSWVMSHARPKRPWLLITLLQAFLAFPAFAVVLVSLRILSGSWRDTEGWREVVSYLVSVQVAGGGTGLFAQGLQVHDGTSPQETDKQTT